MDADENIECTGEKSSLFLILNAEGRVSPILNHCYYHLGTSKFYTVWGGEYHLGVVPFFNEEVLGGAGSGDGA